MRYKLLFIVAVLLICVGGCSRGQTPEQTPAASSNTAGVSVGDKFLASNLKIKSTVTDAISSPEHVYTLELYVDSGGDGQGLLGIGERVIDVKIAKDIMYLEVDSSLVIGISDISGRLVFTDTDFAGEDDLTLLGFKLDGEIPVEYSARRDSLVLESRYAQSVNEFDTPRVVATTTLDFRSAIKYILDYLATGSSLVETPEPETELKDFYVNSKYGITIDGTVFSVGDTCNPSTYFFGQTPEGIVDSHEYKQDERIDFQHISYLSSSGRTVFTVTGGYVQAIKTSAPFSFLGVSQGIAYKDLGKLLGYKLTNAEQEAFVPLDPVLSVDNAKSNVYYCTLGNLAVEFRCSSGSLDEIYVEQKLDFKR